MPLNSSFICIVVIILFAALQFETSLCENIRNSWTKHRIRAELFKCRHPQPRVVHLSELPVDDKYLPFMNKKTLPSSTVLHRCEASGCCPAGKVCRPDRIENVTLVFSGKSLFPTNSKRIFFEVKVTNHTECSCQSLISNPK